MASPAYPDSWQRCLDFHGHSCPGLAIGFRVATAALDMLGTAPQDDEQIVCLAETDSCAVDAIQVIGGCTLGRGSLVLHPTGKHAFTFWRRDTGTGYRFLWLDRAGGDDRDARTARFLNDAPPGLFSAAPVSSGPPEKAGLYPSLPCAGCGESTAEPYLRLSRGHVLCPDCYTPPLRAVNRSI